jgi:hypothetical protein
MKYKKLLILSFLLLNSVTYAMISPMENVITNKLLSKGSFFFQNRTPSAILYEIQIINRSSDKEGKLTGRKKSDFGIPTDTVTVSPKRFVLKPNQGQKINFAIDKKNMIKLDKTMALVGFKVHVVKVVKLKEDIKKNKKMVSSQVGLIPEFTTSIMFLNKEKSVLFSKVKLESFSYKNKKLTVKMSKDSSIFGLGILKISYSKDKKNWEPIVEREERFFIDNVTRKYSLPKELPSGFIRVEYTPNKRYKMSFDKYFSQEFKI